jgi:lysyl-tRNA synthetase class 1
MFDTNNTWPFKEARKIYKKIDGKTPKKGYVLFETGYGPSGLPHIGTFGEIVRTSFVKFAFHKMYPDIPVKMFCVSDDMDALRKVPENVPNVEMLSKNLGMPLTSIPDPFGTEASYGEHNNRKLLSFLSSFGFKEGEDYTFISATESYKSGKHNEMLKKCAQHYQDLMDIMLPTLGEERKETYSPFMPIDPDTGKVISNGVKSVDPEKCTIKYITQSGDEKESSFLNGGCKLQWKCDFGGRWASFGVDYEIYGKDHYPNEPVYRSICKTLGVEPPVNFFYELFLDDKGQKISKSKGNGLTVDEWLKYGDRESLALFMYQKPKTAKKLYFDIIPKVIDEYMMYLEKYSKQSQEEQSENPIFFIHFGKTSEELKKIGFVPCGISYSMMLNLASVCNPDNENILFDFLEKYDKNLNRNNEYLKQLVRGAINYYNDFVKPNKKYVKPSGIFLEQYNKLYNELKSGKYKTEQDFQQLIYDLGNEKNLVLKDWFKCLYQALLGTETGPRIGSFIAIYGLKNILDLIEKNNF